MARSESSRFSPISTPARAHGVHLSEEGLEVDDDARADHGRAAADDAGREEVQGEVLRSELDRVPGVVAAVVAGHDVETVGEQVDELALALVSPLPAQDGQDLHAFVLLFLSAAEKQRRLTEFGPPCQLRIGPR